MPRSIFDHNPFFSERWIRQLPCGHELDKAVTELNNQTGEINRQLFQLSLHSLLNSHFHSEP